MFNEVSSSLNFPEEEAQILKFWEEHDIYQASLRQRHGAKPFVFFEGPPTANGLPHPGHCLTRAMKDLFPRYKTMTGHYCLRKGGWDTHGLPVEVEVCKELGIHSKEEIEEYGVEPFNRKCLESVFRYTQQWETMTKRLGFWVNLEEAYVTYHKSYVESVWWSLKQLFDAGLLYQGHKIVWWWAQGGTALSSGEVGQGYREVDDPSVYVRFPLVMDERAKSLLAKIGVAQATGRMGVSPASGNAGVSQATGNAGVAPAAGNVGVSPAAGNAGVAQATGSVGVSPARNRGTIVIGPDLTIRKRWKLPHWEAGGCTYFLTFRTLAGELAPDERDMVLDACRHWDDDRMMLHAAVVMPDHVHLLCTPTEKEKNTWWSIADLLQSIKSFTAKEINKRRGMEGAVWQPEYFDRIIRSETDYREKWNYIVNNPQKRGLGEGYSWVWVEEQAMVPDDSGGLDARTPRVSLLVWTTTPWTLPSNMYAAVHNDFDYAVVHDTETDERLIFAEALVPTIAKKCKKTDAWKVEAKVKGRDLVGLRYVPPFDCYYNADTSKYVSGAASGKVADHTSTLNAGGDQHVFWRVSSAEFVTLDSGSGLVHEAPAFGEVDYDLFIDNRSKYAVPDQVPLLFCVAPNGTFTGEGPDYCRGRWVKECDKDICRDLMDRGLLLHQEQYRHDYPFCWRADQDPLIQYPRESWFIRTTQFKDDMLENNQHINWLPDHIKSGRFGKFLESNVDWSLSRERYWGTPLPIWVCQSCGHQEAVDSYDSLCGKPGVQGLDAWENAKKADPQISDHLKVHKPYIDAVSYDCPKCDKADAHMHRVSEVIDCWYDSGAMPFAQWGWPHKNQEMFAGQFPANFISEALDQTRGWFYSLTAISVMLFGKNGVARDMIPNLLRDTQSHPFETCIVLGLLMGEDGLKMSKQKKNYKQPDYIFDHEGADAMRWLFFSGQAPWTSIRFQESAIAEGQREFLIRLYNCYTFFVIYANIDRWTPASAVALSDAAKTNELDRWILSELAACSLSVFDSMEAYDNFNAARTLNGFVDALSNWYVRRCRDRFWRSEMDADKNAAYTTLHHCLVALTKLIAPFTPFMAESMYQNLRRSHDGGAPLSVHLCDYPVTPETRAEVAARVDEACNREIEMVRQVVSCGRAARSAMKLRVRQPLASIELFHRDADVIARHEETIRNELNVKAVQHVPADKIDQYVHYEVKPDFKLIGPKYGPLAPKIKKALAGHPNPDEIVKQLEKDGLYHMTVDGQDVELTSDELKVELHAREGYAAERVPGYGIIVLDTHITPELRDEGWARDIVNHIQQIRKKQDLKYEQQIELAIVTRSDDMKRVVNTHAAYIQSETLARSLLNQPLPGAEGEAPIIDDHALQIFVHGV